MKIYVLVEVESIQAEWRLRVNMRHANDRRRRLLSK
jgi:hypothetical protein